MEWVSIVGGVAAAALVTGIFNLIQLKAGKKTRSEAALMLLMRDRLKLLCRSWISKGYIPSTDLEDIEEMHEVYKQLGGNGFLDLLMAQVKKLSNKGRE